MNQEGMGQGGMGQGGTRVQVPQPEVQVPQPEEQVIAPGRIRIEFEIEELARRLAQPGMMKCGCGGCT